LADLGSTNSLAVVSQAGIGSNALVLQDTPNAAIINQTADGASAVVIQVTGEGNFAAIIQK
jgi:hypothetical protein